MTELGMLKKVDLRKAWKHEAIEFTKWLAQEENIALMSEELGIEIHVIQTEASVGNFHADILAEEENTGRKVIIENQLEPTNHDHLGKLITYAAGYEAEIIVWIVENAREEHRQAIEWLNDHTDDETNFFLVQMELWQIDDSKFAPRFHLMVEPNDWAKAIKQSTHKSTLSETKLLQLDFWNALQEYGKKHGTSLRLGRAPRPQHWYNISIGNSDAHMSLTMNTQEQTLGCEIYIPHTKELFHALETDKKAIEQEVGAELEWMELPDRRASRIKLASMGDATKRETWDDLSAWFIQTAEKFDKAFRNRIQQATKEI